MPPCSNSGLPAAKIALRIAILIALILFGLPTNAAPDDLSADQHEWLRQVDPIITGEERQAFSALTREYQREAFIARFWRERDPRPETPQNEFRQVWQQRLDLVVEQFGETNSVRARTMLLIGFPATMMPDLCPELLRPVDAWLYGGTDKHPEDFSLIFYQPEPESDSAVMHWSPEQGYGSLLRSPNNAKQAPQLLQLAERCGRGDEAQEALEIAASWEDLHLQAELFPPEPDPWVEEFLDRTTNVHPDTPAITASMQLRFPGRVQEKAIVQIELVVPVEVATPSEPKSGTFSMRIDGEVLRGDTLFDEFRYDFDLPVLDVVDHEIPFAFQRQLLPGSYSLILRLQDRVSGHAFRSEGPLQVPHPSETAGSSDTPLAEANAVLNTRDHMVKIQPLPEQLLTDRVRVEAVALGESIAKVTFVLNGQQVMSKTRAPYSLEIDLGRSPRLHWLEAVAFDNSGMELARDRVPVNAGPHRFAVRLVEPRYGERYINSLRASAEVHLPAGEKLERVDFYLNERRIASLYQPPFVQPLLLPQTGRITYVRAVAYLDDGNATEDLVLINAPQDLASLRINMVELFTTVCDKKGKPVKGLSLLDFIVREEGQEQEVGRFERVQDLSVHAGVILDASTSMSEEIAEAVDGALQFFEAVIEPKDRASVVVFNDEPILKVPFTNNLNELAKGLEDIESEGDTALYDTLVFTLHYFAGIRGKRALILLSDGEDSRSRYTFSETLEFAQRSGVAVYTIGLGLDRRQPGPRSVLQQLAQETGGRFFFISSIRELAGIYSTIETELRSQYLLAFQSTHEEGGDFRRVEVELRQDGLKAKTIPGYYP